MLYLDAIMEILDTAGPIKLPHYRLDVVTIARREFAQRGFCDNKFIAPIEGTLRDCLRKWSIEQKRELWFSTETGTASLAMPLRYIDLSFLRSIDPPARRLGRRFFIRTSRSTIFQ